MNAKDKYKVRKEERYLPPLMCLRAKTKYKIRKTLIAMIENNIKSPLNKRNHTHLKQMVSFVKKYIDFSLTPQSG